MTQIFHTLAIADGIGRAVEVVDAVGDVLMQGENIHGGRDLRILPPPLCILRSSSSTPPSCEGDSTELYTVRTMAIMVQ
jgi:hypothetical protein